MFQSIDCVCRSWITHCTCASRGCNLSAVSLCCSCTVLLTYPPANLVSTQRLLSRGLSLRYEPGPYINRRFQSVASQGVAYASSAFFFFFFYSRSYKCVWVNCSMPDWCLIQPKERIKALTQPLIAFCLRGCRNTTQEPCLGTWM